MVSCTRAADIPTISATFSVQGAIATASGSFSIAWLLHWSRSRTGPGFKLQKLIVLSILVPVLGALVVLSILVPVLGVLFYVFARRQWLKHLRHQAVNDTAMFISNAQGFDSAASASVVFVQEVELVSKEYRMYACPLQRR